MLLKEEEDASLILEFLESAGVVLVKSRVNLVEALQPFSSEYLETQNRINKTFIFEPASSHIYVEIDQHKFMQVINNLILTPLNLLQTVKPSLSA